MTLSICSVGAARGDDVSICFEFCSGDQIQRERLVISAAQFASLSVMCGPCDRETYELISHAARVHAALRAGLSALSYGACSSGRLLRKLMAKGIDRDIAKEAVALLEADGYLSDRSNAEREAEKCVAKRWGKRRILSSLYEKGYSDAAVRAAMLHLEEMEVDFERLCAEQMCVSCRAVPSTPSEREKLFAAMARYGYSSSEIRAAYRLYLEEYLDD